MGKGQESIKHVPDRPGPRSPLRHRRRKIRRELGWQPTRSAWPAALEETVRWYVENENWWRRVKSGAYREYYERQYATA